MRFKVVLLVVSFLVLAFPAIASACSSPYGYCPTPAPEASAGEGELVVSYVEGAPGAASRKASPTQPTPTPYRWRLRTPCEIDDSVLGGCQPGQRVCPTPPGTVVLLYRVQRQRVAQPNREPIENLAPGLTIEVGAGYGNWINEGESCVDITDLNPPPSPDEVFRYFQTLPLPQLTTRQQPPGEALVGLPVIFFTDSPTTQTFTVDIRGFAVTITARATSFTWTTGDGATLTTADPGAPYPHQTVTHDYAAGTYTAGLTTTWGGTFTVDGGAAADVPGTTTTQGAPATFAVRQARAVLTNPYD